MRKPLKWYKSLTARKGRREAGAFIVEGERAVAQIVSNNPDDVIEIIATGQLPPLYRKYPHRRVTESQLRSIGSTRTPQGIAAVVRTPQDTYSHRLPDKTGAKILLLEDVQDPGNVGTLIRTAAAFGFAGVILSDKCADPLSPKCVQATAGTVLAMWLRRTERYLEMARTLRARGYYLVATALDGQLDTSVLSNRDNLLLALGNEAAGLSPAVLDAADYRLKIPMAPGQAESLNVAACGAICMYLSRRDG